MIDECRERRNTWVDAKTEGKSHEPPNQPSSAVPATVLAGEQHRLPVMTR